MKYGLALEGGGARGAYHIGAVKALLENGYEFDAVVGTSIGAVNAAFIAQGDIEEVYKMWSTLTFSDLFDIEDDKIRNAMNMNLDISTVKYLSKKLSKAIKDKGINTLKMRKLLDEKIDEKKLRKSDMKFGLVTYCLSDRNGEELLIDDMEDGKVIDYIMASSNLPVFKRVKVNDKNYVDGGVYDNCPVHLLEKIGIKDAIVIRTYKRMRIRNYKEILKRGNVSMHMIEPIDALPNILNFETNNLNEQLKLGYFDAMKMIKDLDGIRYYIEPIAEEELINRIKNIPYDKMEEISSYTNTKLYVGENIKDIMKEKIIPYIASKTKTRNLETFKDCIYAIFENIALENNINRYKIYTFDEFIEQLKKQTSNIKNKAVKLLIENI